MHPIIRMRTDTGAFVNIELSSRNGLGAGSLPMKSSTIATAIARIIATKTSISSSTCNTDGYTP